MTQSAVIPELFKPRGPWRTAEQVEIAVLEWVDWYNHRRGAVRVSV